MALKVQYDKSYLLDTNNSSDDTLRYYVEASSYLYEFLVKHQINNNTHFMILEEWLKHFDIEEDDINYDDFMALLDLTADNYKNIPKRYIRNDIRKKLIKLAQNEDVEISASKYTLFLNVVHWRKEIQWKSTNAISKVMGIIGFIYGPIGQFLLLCESNINSQFLREFKRLFSNNDTFISNHFLFYIASLFNKIGYKVRFIPENNLNKTPDLIVSKSSQSIYIEATANRSDTTKIDVSKIVWNSIQEKQVKYDGKKYKPGLIAIDLGDQDLTKDELDLLKDNISTDDKDNKYYDVYKDKEFKVRNSESSVNQIIDYFKKIDINRGIDYILVVQSNILVMNSKEISWPQRVLLVSSRNAEIIKYVSKTNFIV